MPSVLALFAFVLLVLGGYGYVNQPTQEPPWNQAIPGFAFSPYQDGQSPITQVEPELEDINRDLALLAGKTQAIRTYTVAGVFGEIPRLAKAHNINVAMGAWLSVDLQANAKELERMMELAERPPYNVIRLIVGNEAILREDLTVEQVIAYLDTIRNSTDIPVSTAEPWHVWLKNPELAEHVDYLAVHLLPFWEGIALDDAVDFSINTYRQLQQTFPGKPIVVTEVGWPSRGRSIRDANASQANQAKFLRRFIQRAEQEGIVFYVMEAFDQPWKSDIEGSVGGHWGVFDSFRNPKFEPDRPIIAIPQWKLLAAASVLVALLILSGNSVMHAVFKYGAMAARLPACPVSVNYALMGGDYGRLKHVIEMVRPAVVFAEQTPAFRAALESVDFGDAALVTDEPSLDWRVRKKLQITRARIASPRARRPTSARR